MPEDYGAEAGNEPPEGNGGGQSQPGGGNPQSGQDAKDPDFEKKHPTDPKLHRFVKTTNKEEKGKEENIEESKTESAAEKQEQPKENKNENTVEKGEEKQEQAENTESETLSHIKIDFNKDNILPALNKSDAEELGVKSLPVRLKKSILERQASKHPETIKDTEQIISSAVYSPDVKLPGKQPGYMHFIKQLKKDSHSLVLLDLKESDDGYYDIVHYFKIDDRNKRRISRGANKTS